MPSVATDPFIGPLAFVGRSGAMNPPAVPRRSPLRPPSSVRTTRAGHGRRPGLPSRGPVRLTVLGSISAGVDPIYVGSAYTPCRLCTPIDRPDPTSFCTPMIRCGTLCGERWRRYGLKIIGDPPTARLAATGSREKGRSSPTRRRLFNGSEGNDLSLRSATGS